MKKEKIEMDLTQEFGEIMKKLEGEGGKNVNVVGDVVKGKELSLEELLKHSENLENSQRNSPTGQESANVRLRKFIGLAFPLIDVAGVLGTSKENVTNRAKRLVGEWGAEDKMNVEIVRVKGGPTLGATPYGVIQLFSTAGTRSGRGRGRIEELCSIAKEGNIDCSDCNGSTEIFTMFNIMRRLQERNIITGDIITHYTNMIPIIGRRTFLPLWRAEEILRVNEIFNNIFYILNIALIYRDVQVKMDWEEMKVKFRFL